jgi:hypothetical protein
MQFEAPRPAWVEGFNAMGADLLGEGTALLSLDRDELMRAARVNTGLEDFGGDDFTEPLDVLLDSLEHETHLTLLGRVLARSDVLNLLENRLRITETVRQQPAILEERIEAPLFIVGLSRSGTSILHELLAQDPRARAPLSWEARFPCPPPVASNYRTDPRIDAADRIFTFWNEIVPDYQKMHEMGGRIPCECVWLSAHSFRAEEFLGRQQTPSYGAWLMQADMTPAFDYHKLMLKMFQHAMPTQRWVLKAPSHMIAMRWLFEAYPDARVVQTHRDPLSSMGSTASILSALAWMRQSEVDIELIKAGFAGEGLEARLGALLEARDSGVAPSEQFFDVRFHELMSDPFEVLRALHAHFDIELSADAERRMRDYLAAKPRGKHGKHEYAFDDLGLDLAEERARFAGYQKRFDVPSEDV